MLETWGHEDQVCIQCKALEKDGEDFLPATWEKVLTRSLLSSYPQAQSDGSRAEKCDGWRQPPLSLSANLNLQQSDLFAVGYLEISLVYKSSSCTVNSVAECDVADWVVIKAGLWLALGGSSVCPESCRRGSGKTSDEHGQSPGLAGSWLSSIICSFSPYQFCCLWPQSLWARDHHVSACSVWHYVRSKVPDLVSYS